MLTFNEFSPCCIVYLYLSVYKLGYWTCIDELCSTLFILRVIDFVHCSILVVEVLITGRIPNHAARFLL